MHVTPTPVTEQLWDKNRSVVFEKHIPADHDYLSQCRAGLIDFKRGEELSWREKSQRVTYCIKQGTVKIVASGMKATRETILAILGPGELFGHMPMVGGGHLPCVAVAMEDCILCELSSAEIESMMVRHPEIATRITKMIGERLQRLEARVSQLLFKDARQRVAYILLELRARWGSPARNGGDLLDLRITHQEIANMAGLTRETVSVTLAELELDEVLRTIGRKLIVMNPDKLRAIIEGPSR